MRGKVGRDQRARHQGDGPLTAEAQAACLLDQATDPNILGRTCAHPRRHPTVPAWALLQAATSIHHSRAPMMAAHSVSFRF